MAVIRYSKEERDHALVALHAFAAEARWKAVRAEATAAYFVSVRQNFQGSSPNRVGDFA
jgi:hypothetical protein